MLWHAHWAIAAVLLPFGSAQNGNTGVNGGGVAVVDPPFPFASPSPFSGNETSYPTSSPFCGLCGLYGGSPLASNQNLPIASGSSTTCDNVETLISTIPRYTASCYLLQATTLPARCGCPTPAPTLAPVSYPVCPICSGGQQISLPYAQLNLSTTLSSSFYYPQLCSDFSYYGTFGLLPPADCAKLSQIGASTICGCRTFPPGPTTCEAATPLIQFQTVLASIPNNTASLTRSMFCGVTIDTPGVWFSFIGTGGLVTASTCGFANFDAKISVFSGTNCAENRCVGGNQYYCGSQSSYTWFATSGVTYSILVHGLYDSSYAGAFNLTLTDQTNPPTEAPTPYPTSAPTSLCNICDQSDQQVTQLDAVVDSIPGKAPTTCGDLQLQGLSGLLSSSECSALTQQGVATTCGCATLDNDNCAAATPIAAGQTIFGSNIAATRPNIALCGTSIDGPGAWFIFTASILGRVTASTCTESSSFSFDTKISVFKGTCTDLVCVGGNDDYCNLQSTVSWIATAGTDYFILVHGYSGAVGSFAFTVAETPVASVNTPAPSVTGTFSPTVGRYPDCSICGSSTNRVSLPNAVIGPSGYQNCFTAEYSGLTGQVEPSICAILQELDLSTTCACITPTGSDICPGAITVSLGESVNGTTNNATFDNVEPCGDVYSQAPGVWYRFVGSGLVQANTCEFADFSTAITVLSGSCGALTCVGGNSFFCGELGSRVTWNAVPGVVYFILVHSSYGTGKFRLTVSAVTPPANDLCANAASISPGDIVSASTTDATVDNAGPCGSDVNATASPGIWFKVTSSGDPTRYIADTCNSRINTVTNFNTAISVFAGSCNQPVCVAGNDNACGGQSRVVWVSDTAQDYFILVRGFGSNYSRSDFQLALTEVPATPTVSPAPSSTYYSPSRFVYFGGDPKDGSSGGGFGEGSAPTSNLPPSNLPPFGAAKNGGNPTDAPVSPEKPQVSTPTPVTTTVTTPELTPSPTTYGLRPSKAIKDKKNRNGNNGGMMSKGAVSSNYTRSSGKKRDETKGKMF